MTTAARKALSDLEYAHSLLEVEESTQRFRILWVASISLSRAVGHVLEKIDSKASPELRATISKAYLSWKQDPETHQIFFEFIEDERNSVLKEYEFGFMSGPIDVMVLPDGTSFSLSENLFCPLAGGRFAGEDCRDVLQLAISWWKAQLASIDEAAAK